MASDKFDSSRGQFSSFLSLLISWEDFASGIEHCSGDMFVSIPKGDAIFMKVGF